RHRGAGRAPTLPRELLRLRLDQWPLGNHQCLRWKRPPPRLAEAAAGGPARRRCRMSRFLGALCVFVAFALLGWVALEAGPIDGRHALALILFAVGSSLIITDRDPQLDEEEDW